MVSAFCACHFAAGDSRGSGGRGRNGAGAPFCDEQQHQRWEHDQAVDSYEPTEQPRGEVETDRRNKAKLSPPSTTEDQQSDDRLEHHQKTDKQILVRAKTARHSAVTQPKCAWSPISATQRRSGCDASVLSSPASCGICVEDCRDHGPGILPRATDPPPVLHVDGVLPSWPRTRADHPPSGHLPLGSAFRCGQRVAPVPRSLRVRVSLGIGEVTPGNYQPPLRPPPPPPPE